MRTGKTKKVNVLFSIGLLGIVYLLIEGLSFLFLSVLETKYGIPYAHVLRGPLTLENRVKFKQFLTGEGSYFIYSPTLGWTIKPGGSYSLYRANSRGLRADRDYVLEPPPGKVRIAAFGDSFTHGDEAALDETWESGLERLDGGLEVLNFGVNGYGPDQAFLRYKEQGTAHHPHIVLIGLLSENIRRTVSLFRPFYYQDTTLPLSKPRFLFEGDRFVLMENPLAHVKDADGFLQNEREELARLGAYDYHYRIKSDSGALDVLPSVRLLKIILYAYRSRFTRGHMIRWDGTYDPDSEAFRVTLKILEVFRETSLENGSFPLIVLFPERQDLIKFRTRGIHRYGSLVDELHKRGIAYVDLMDAFGRYGKDETVEKLIPTHYSPLGNAIVARFLFNYLRENNLLTLEGVSRRLRGE